MTEIPQVPQICPPDEFTENVYRGSSSSSQKMLGKYYISKTIGKGSMGKVKLAINTFTHEKVAVKIVSRKCQFDSTIAETSEDVQKRLEKAKSREIRAIKEASILVLLNHPNIVQVHELILTENHYYLFMEYIDGGQLLDFIISHGKLTESKAKDFLRQIASALDYCHRNSIVHRDLKVENILISRDGTLKIIDFGLSNLYSPRSHLSTFCGSLYFAAPEVLDGRKYTGPEVDVWSFGVIIYVLVCGQVPFDDPSVRGMHIKVKEGRVEYPSHLSSDCKSILQSMLITDSKKRANMADIKVHPWMTKGYDMPIDDYLPRRKPLELPLDMDVIRGMSGFQFGSEEEIRMKLQHLISREDYQLAAKQIESLPEQSTLNPTKARSLLTRSRSLMSTSKNDEPFSPVYHPLISIYHLVKERKERENQKRLPISPLQKADSKESTFESTTEGGLLLENIMEEMFGKSITTESSKLSSAYGSYDSGKDINNAALPVKQGLLFRIGRRLSRQANEPVSPAQLGKINSPPMVTVNGSKMYEDECVLVNSNQTSIKSETKYNRFKKRATSITVKDFPSLKLSKSTEEYDLPRRQSAFSPTLKPSMTTNNGHLAPPPLLISPNNKEPLNETSKKNHQADESIRSVYLKGLFQVSNTSTKKASAIRQEIIRVLDGTFGIQYEELEGKFECSVATTKVTPEDENDFYEYSDEENCPSVHPSSVRFEIYIVKISWFPGLRGIQFKRIGGDPWDYKSTCCKILTQLML